MRTRNGAIVKKSLLNVKRAVSLSQVAWINRDAGPHARPGGAV